MLVEEWDSPACAQRAVDECGDGGGPETSDGGESGETVRVGHGLGCQLDTSDWLHGEGGVIPEG
jgi:hypothetical protein